MVGFVSHQKQHLSFSYFCILHIHHHFVPMHLENIFTTLGFSEPEIKIYRAILEKGQASVRTLAEKTNIGRGTVYNILKRLKEKGLVSYSERGKLKYFAVENPEKLLAQFEEKKRALDEAASEFQMALPELQALFGPEKDQSKVTYHVGLSGIRTILEDILFTLNKAPEKVVRLYSSEELRGIIYEAYPQFTQRRIDAAIKARVIKMGGTGVLRGLDEAKLLPVDKSSRTYVHVYGNKISYITSKSNGHILAAIIEDSHIAQTHAFLFDSLWEHLPNPVDMIMKDEDF